MGRKDRERLAGELERRTADFDGYYSAIWGGRWASIRSSLLVERRLREPAKGTLDLPGGFVDGNETGEEAIAREVQEETGGIVTESTYLFSLPNLYEYSGLTIPTLDMFFACRLADDRYLHADDDVAACRFVPLDEIDPQQFGLQSIRRAVERFLKQKR